MVTRQTKLNSFSSSSQERVEQTAQQAGIADGFGHLTRLAPQVLELQQSLLAGIVQSQRREAERLARLYGKDDARIARAVERASQVSHLYAEAQAQAVVVNRVVQTFQQDGIFHGYVHLADGTAAVGYAVKLELRDANDKRLQGGTGKTDDTGYFRIDLNQGGDTTPQDVNPIRRWSDRLARMVADEVGMTQQAPEAPAAEAAAPDAPPTVVVPGQPGATSRVEVLDPSGKLLLEDPDPPTFEASTSEFRYYVIGDASSSKTTTGTVRKKK